MNAKTDYRLKLKNGTYLNAGTGVDSWFTLERAYILRKKNKDSVIEWHNKYGFMGEVM